MKKITVISGKGGTGKTSITGAFAGLSKNCVMVDCDVDAANLYLLVAPICERKLPEKFIGGKEAVIDRDKCTSCGACIDECRFDAIEKNVATSGCVSINPIFCEGCGLCARKCPESAIRLISKTSGEIFISNTRFGPLVRARLEAGEGSSGKLVSLIRKYASDLAASENADYIIADGAPGTGCPVIASITGADIAVIVCEPTVSGLHDLKRVAALCQKLSAKTAVIINKYDINMEMTDEIEKYSGADGIHRLGRVSFSRVCGESISEAKTVVEKAPDSLPAEQITAAWQNLADLLKKL